MKLVSVIIPIYNTAQYLSKCLDSILLQTYSNIEVILINDGSTDDSLIICQDYLKKNPRFRLINKCNTGQSDSRYIGFKASSGEYIYCVDSDDYIEPNAIQTLVDGLESTQADIYFCRFRLVDENNREISKSKKYNKRIIEGKRHIINDALLAKDIKASLCIKLCKRKLWEAAYNKEVLKVQYNEDYLFTFLFSCYSEKVGFSNEVIYNALQRHTSVSRQPRPQVITSHEIYFPIIEEKLKKFNIYDLEETSFFRGYSKNIYYSLFIIVTYVESYKSFLEFYNLIDEQSILRSEKMKLYIESEGVIWRFIYRIVKSPKLFYNLSKCLTYFKKH